MNNALYGNQPDSPDFLRKSMPPQQVLAEYPALQKLWARVIDAHQPGAQEVHAPAVGRSVFWRKPGSAFEMFDRPIAPDAVPLEAQNVRVIDRQVLSTSDYDRFVADFFAPKPWLKGQGGIEKDQANGTRLVVEVAAEKRQTLHIDPQGYDYARYVGIPEVDIDRVFAQRSLASAPDRQRQVQVQQMADAPEPDKPERSARPRLRQSSRKAAAMER